MNAVDTQNDAPVLIVADRASLRAYAVEFPPEREPFPRRFESIDLTDTHRRLSEKVTDQAGAFPRGSAPDATSFAERQGIEHEDRQRAVKQIGELIGRILDERDPVYWSLAVPIESHQAIIAQIPSKWMGLLRQEVTSNLVNVPEQELGRHFSITRK